MVIMTTNRPEVSAWSVDTVSSRCQALPSQRCPTRIAASAMLTDCTEKHAGRWAAVAAQSAFNSSAMGESCWKRKPACRPVRHILWSVSRSVLEQLNLMLRSGGSSYTYRPVFVLQPCHPLVSALSDVDHTKCSSEYLYLIKTNRSSREIIIESYCEAALLA